MDHDLFSDDSLQGLAALCTAAGAPELRATVNSIWLLHSSTDHHSNYLWHAGSSTLGYLCLLSGVYCVVFTP